MKVGSLFSGTGALDLAVEHITGAQPAWFVEFDPAPSKILAHHWPQVPNYGDVTQVRWEDMPPVDIITGGFPCQPFSAAGLRDGESDERHLWPYVLEAIRALRPSYVVLENVSGLRSIGGTFDEPEIRCVCGWSGRWGRVHYRKSHQVGDRNGNSSPHRNGDEGAGCPGTDEGHIWRHSDHSGTNEPEALPHHDMDRYWGGSSGFSAQDRAASDFEIRAGMGGPQDRGDSYFPGKDRDTRSFSMDRREHVSVPGSLPAPERAELTWQGNVLPRQGEGVCPACGRAVGDGSSGPVFRSGLGVVYGDLASIGFDAWWTSLRAANVGAPHHRERLFILAVPADSRGLGLETQRLSGGQAAEVTGDHDGDDALAGIGGAADIDHEARLRWGDAGRRVMGWAQVNGDPPPIIEDEVTYHDEKLWGRAFPEVRPVLNPAFSEWMMGLPAGWITDVPGLSRADQLKAAGNGVVPQQAAAALTQLLEMFNQEKESA